MSSDDNNNNNTDPTDGSNKAEAEGPTDSLPTNVDISTIRQGISQGVRSGVEGINAALAQLHSATETVQKPIATAVGHVDQVGSQAATQLRIAHQRRHEFAPYYIAGATVGVGGLTALRRGRLPGVTLGILAGVLTYVTLYEPLAEQPGFQGGWLKDWRSNLRSKKD